MRAGWARNCRNTRSSAVFAAFVASVATSIAALPACGSSGDTGDPQPLGPDAAIPDPVVDGSAPATDAGTDAADAAPDVIPTPGTHYCTKLAQVPRFCDDFDDGDLTNDWTQFVAPAGSLFQLDTTSSTSAPASFHLGANATAAAAANNVLLRTTMFGVVKHGKLAFSVFLPNVTFALGAIAIAQFYVNLDDVYTLYLRGPDDAANAPLLEAYVGGVITRYPLTKLPPANAWTRVELDLDLAGGKASVSFGADKVLDAQAIGVLTGSEATVRLGAIIDGPASALEARFDDVVLDY
jgi:hypothetical protein